MQKTTGDNNLEKTSKTASQLSMTTRLRCLKKDGLFGLLVSVHDGSALLLWACDETKAHHDGEGTKEQAAHFRTAGRRTGKEGGNQCRVASSNGSLCSSLKLPWLLVLRIFFFYCILTSVKLEAKPSTQGLGKTPRSQLQSTCRRNCRMLKPTTSYAHSFSGWKWASAHGKWGKMMPEQTWD